jgi:galactokinase
LLAAAAAQAWRAATGRDDPHLAAAVESPGFSAERMVEVLLGATGMPFSPDDLCRRFEHFYLEHVVLLPAAVEALRIGDVAAFGDLFDRSQEGADQLLKNQIEETVFLARQARTLGAVAASAFGAGFGGSVWALVQEGDAAGMQAAWKARYAEVFPRAAGKASFFEERPGPAAFELGEVLRAL